MNPCPDHCLYKTKKVVYLSCCGLGENLHAADWVKTGILFLFENDSGKGNRFLFLTKIDSLLCQKFPTSGQNFMCFGNYWITLIINFNIISCSSRLHRSSQVYFEQVELLVKLCQTYLIQNLQ